MKEFHLNGKRHQSTAATIAELAGEVSPSPQLLVIELNGKALLRSEWSEMELCPGDHVEVLQVAAGG